MQTQTVIGRKEALDYVYKECARMSDEHYQRSSPLDRFLNNRAELLTKNIGGKNLYVIAGRHGARRALDIAYGLVTNTVIQQPENWKFMIEGYDEDGQKQAYYPEIDFLIKSAGILGAATGNVIYDFRSDPVMERAAKLMRLTPRQVKAVTFLKLFRGLKSMRLNEQTPYLDKRIAEYEMEITDGVDMEPGNIVHSNVMSATNSLSRELFGDWLGKTKATHVLAYCGSDHKEVFI